MLTKPEQVREKIVEGRLEKWFAGPASSTDQAWIHDVGPSVGEVLAEAGLEVLEFARFALAE